MANENIYMGRCREIQFMTLKYPNLFTHCVVQNGTTGPQHVSNKLLSFIRFLLPQGLGQLELKEEARIFKWKTHE